MASESLTPIFQDQDLLIINKPAGLLSVPDGYDPNLPHLRSVLEPTYGKIWIVHRLDKETSGVMVLAKNPEAHRKLNAMFRNREVTKIYHCLVYPTPTWTSLDIQLPLEVNADRKHRTRVNKSQGKQARSQCNLKKHLNSSALLEIKIGTGITHQIRAHLREVDLAILGDDLYSAGLHPPPIEVPRMMLHARSLSFTHIRTSENVQFTANYPDDFRQAYTKLRLTTRWDKAF